LHPKGEWFVASIPSVCAPSVSGIDWQLDELRRIFPELQNAKVARPKFSEEVLSEAESILAVPKWNLLSTDYNASISRVVEALSAVSEWKLNIRCSNRLADPEYLRRSEYSKRAVERISVTQPESDFLIFPFQSGHRHRDISARKATEFMEEKNRKSLGFRCEFGLGLFETVILLLLFPERLACREDLWFYCAGDEAAYEPRKFNHVPTVSFRDGGIRLSFQGNTGANLDYGIPTGFVPA
jgi:hypothetical protein